MKSLRIPIPPFLRKYGPTILLLLSAALLRITALDIHDKELWQSNGTRKAYTLPSRIPSDEDVPYYVYKGSIDKSWVSQQKVRLIPDGSIFYIKINGTVIQSAGMQKTLQTTSPSGFTFPIGKHLTNGCNTVEISISDSGKEGMAGLNIRSSLRDPLFLILFLLFNLSCCMVFQQLLRAWGLTPALAVIATIPLALGLFYFLHNEFWSRGYDIDGHLDYIGYLIENGRLPAKNELWVSYHPPGYYALAAAFYPIVKLLGIDSLIVSTQILAMLLFLVFLGYSMLTIDRLIISRWGKLTAGLLFAALPANVLHFPRIANDGLLYTLSGAVFYYLIRWGQEQRHRHILIATGLALVSLFTKTNGILLAAIVLLAMGLQFLRLKGRQRLIAGAIIACTALLTFTCYKTSMSNLGRPVQQESHKGEIVANASQLSTSIRVGNSVKNLLGFKPRIYLREPFTNGCENGKGRNYFFNFFLKTFLFGEFSNGTPAAASLAAWLSILLLPLIAFSLLAIPPLLKQGINIHLIVPAYLFLSVAALLYLRYTVPYACAGDARYIYPAATAWVILTGWFIDRHQTGRSKPFSWILSGAVTAFALYSIALNIALIA